ncbi:MAG TPA: response regulator [Anaerolineales bacterium]|nr:response regulator [Anaerolineales bacterium]
MAKILVIDDDIDVRQILQVMLKRGGHEVSLAQGGLSGVEMASSQVYDLVITDVMMPDMDGYEVTKRLRTHANTKDQLILILTARAQPADYQAAMAAGADAYLSKPVTHDMLNMRVAELLRIKDIRQNQPPNGLRTPLSVSQPLRPATTGSLSDKPSNAASATPSAIEPARTAEPKPTSSAQPSTHPEATVKELEQRGVGKSPEPPVVPAAPNLAEIAQTLKFVTCLSLRGGVGTTTLAVNTALQLVKARKKVCLLDLSPNVGHVALQLGLKPDPTWQEMAPEPDPRYVGKLLLKHTSGLFVLAAPTKPLQRTLHINAFTHLCKVLSGFFHYVVIDGLTWPSELTSEIVRNSKQILLPLSPEIGAVHTLKHVLRYFAGTQLNCTPQVVLNQIQPNQTLPTAAIEKALGQTLAASLPYEPEQYQALLHGKPLSLSQPQSAFVQALQTFTQNW